MPAKKKGDIEEKEVVLGRFGKSLKMGLVGLPNVGKSTTFNFLSKQHVPAENYAFCTKEPHLAKVSVPDPRFDRLCQIYKPAKKVQASLNIWDIAGLIKGAHEGQGLGNQFLSNIQSVDGIYHVVRAFQNDEIMHVEDSIDPVRDIKIINNELVMKDLKDCQTRIDLLEKAIHKMMKNEDKEELACLKKAEELLLVGKWVREGKWTGIEIEWLNKHLFMTAKPVVYLINIGLSEWAKKKNKFLPEIKSYIDQNCNGKMIPFSAEYETLLENETDPAKLADSAVAKIISTGFETLNLINFFTGGPDEVRGWTITKGQNAKEAAGKIHSDMEDGFIAAEVIAYDDLNSLETESAVKNAGKYMQKGKTYIVNSGDIMLIKFNPPAKKK